MVHRHLGMTQTTCVSLQQGLPVEYSLLVLLPHNEPHHNSTNDEHSSDAECDWESVRLRWRRFVALAWLATTLVRHVVLALLRVLLRVLLTSRVTTFAAVLALRGSPLALRGSPLALGDSPLTLGCTEP